QLMNWPGRVLLAADSAGRREALLELLRAADLRPEVLPDWPAFAGGEDRFAITVAALEDGFVLTEPRIAVLTEQQLFPERAQQSRRRRKAVRDPDAVLRDLSEIQVGSPIVHEDHGVGRYQGPVTLDTRRVPSEFRPLEYDNGHKLHAPVPQPPT